jgi:hypothetical protein
MVFINIKSKKIVIQSSDKEIFNWKHQLFFVTLSDFTFDENKQSYVFSDNTQIIKTLNEVIQYFDEEKIKYQCDEKTENIISDFEKENKEYKYSLKKGIQIKKDKCFKANIVKFIRELKSYQKVGVNHLLEIKNGANFSVPGSGKTSVIYAVYDILRSKNIIDKIFVIGPRSCFYPWEFESVECFGKQLESARLSGSKSYRTSLYIQSDKFELFLCTYQTALNDISEIIRLCKQNKVFLIIDESHNIKKFEGGKWSEALLKISPHAVRRAILSGTPMPNEYKDLWTQLTFLWPNEQILGSRINYNNFINNNKDNFIHNYLINNVNPFFMRVTKSDLQLPKFKIKKYLLDLKPIQSSIYRTIAVKYLKDIEVIPTERIRLRQWRKAKMIRLIQVSSNPALLSQYSEEFNIPPLDQKGASVIQLIENYPDYEIPAKFEMTIKLANDLLNKGEKVIIWTSFILNIKMLKKYLKDAFIIYGAIPLDENENVEFNREQQIKQFKEIDKPSILIANPAACAESISLHKVCHHAIYFDRTFNCAQFIQSKDRIHRIGLASNEIVTYHILLANKTIDETIDRRLIEKEKRMIEILENDLPIGSFETENYEMVQSSDEELLDFEETIKDLRSKYKL